MPVFQNPGVESLRIDIPEHHRPLHRIRGVFHRRGAADTVAAAFGQEKQSLRLRIRLRCIFFQPGTEFPRAAFPPFTVSRQQARQFEFGRSEVFTAEFAKLLKRFFRFRRNRRTRPGFSLLLLYAGVEQPGPTHPRLRPSGFRCFRVERECLVFTLRHPPAAFETDRKIIGSLRTA